MRKPWHSPERDAFCTRIQEAAMDQRVTQLYDDFTHAHFDRRLFLDRLGRLVGGAAAALALAAELESKSALAQTIAETDARLLTGEVTYPGATLPMKAYVARPAGSTLLPAIIVIHENRGLQPHIRDVARRAALAGHVALAPDFMSPIGGTPQGEDEARVNFSGVQPTVALANALKTVAYLNDRPDVIAGRIGAVGFCWGGALVGQIAAAGAELRGGVVFYGLAPPLEKVPSVRMPLQIHLAGLDERVNASQGPFESALKAEGKPVATFVYPGVNHAFHNDTAGPRYDAAAAGLAWTRTLAFFKETLA
jgi:carboxymethylenebutenolidase